MAKTLKTMPDRVQVWFREPALANFFYHSQ